MSAWLREQALAPRRARLRRRASRTTADPSRPAREAGDSLAGALPVALPAAARSADCVAHIALLRRDLRRIGALVLVVALLLALDYALPALHWLLAPIE